MATISKKVIDRFTSQLPRFQKFLQAAKDRDVNEADTVAIVSDIIAEVFGFEKYSEITGEFAIRSTYCDLAVKIDNAVKYLVEVKAIGLNLKENHLRQALDYGANNGIEWVVLTNGISWAIHRVLFQRPIGSELVCEMNLLELSARKPDDQERLFLLCKEGISKSAMQEFHGHRQVVNRFVISALLFTQPVVDSVRREIRRLAPEMRVTNEEIESLLANEILKREVMDGESAKMAQGMIKKASARALRKATERTGVRQPEPAAETPDSPDSDVPSAELAE